MEGSKADCQFRDLHCRALALAHACGLAPWEEFGIACDVGHQREKLVRRVTDCAAFGVTRRRQEAVSLSARHAPRGKIGGLQQIGTPPASLARAYAPRVARSLLSPLVPHLTGLLAIAEDQPRYTNQVAIDRSRLDQRSMPELVVHHRYTERDEAARAALVRSACAILRRAGALACHVHPIRTFSHALGTVRMGDDPRSAPLDRAGHFRGVPGLFVTDGSALPTSGGVNPSLTIAANALRIGTILAADSGAPEER